MFLHTLRTALFTLVAMMLCACASNPDKLPTSYVSTYKYKDFDCTQITSEMENVSARSRALYNQLARERNADNVQMGLGLVLFWPALFFLEGGDGPQAAEFSQLKGEFEALRQNAVVRKCEVDVASPEDVVAEAAEAARLEQQAREARQPLR